MSVEEGLRDEPPRVRVLLGDRRPPNFGDFAAHGVGGTVGALRERGSEDEPGDGGAADDGQRGDEMGEFHNVGYFDCSVGL